MAEDRVVSKGIVSNPHRMSGQPCIEGRRLPAQMVADLAADLPIEQIIDDYDLTYADVVNAKWWARREQMA